MSVIGNKIIIALLQKNQVYEQLVKNFKIIRDNSTMAQHQFISIS